MTATALVSGKLAKAQERKVSKNGKPYGVANVRVGAGDATTWWRVMVFDADEVDRLMELSAGETVSASGSFNAETYVSKKDGSTKIGFTLLADAVLTALRAAGGPTTLGWLKARPGLGDRPEAAIFTLALSQRLRFVDKTRPIDDAFALALPGEAT